MHGDISTTMGWALADERGKGRAWLRALGPPELPLCPGQAGVLVHMQWPLTLPASPGGGAPPQPSFVLVAN